MNLDEITWRPECPQGDAPTIQEGAESLYGRGVPLWAPWSPTYMVHLHHYTLQREDDASLFQQFADVFCQFVEVEGLLQEVHIFT